MTLNEDIIKQTPKELEKRFKVILESLGLPEWTTLWAPDVTQPRGQILPEAKTILIHDNEPQAAIDTLLHEVLEIKLRPSLRIYRSLANTLIEWADGQAYKAKERAIEDLLPFLAKFVEDEIERCIEKLEKIVKEDEGKTGSETK